MIEGTVSLKCSRCNHCEVCQWVDLKMDGCDWFEEEPRTRWILVSERLPEEYKEVVVTDIETSDTYLSRYIGNGYWECDNGLFKNRIIAWQPKPKPYKVSPTGEESEE